ncbi:MAG TPA: DMT family transporter [Gaiellaceae bacterium]|nr:DMT family transporter [Gaiellaceae bacterium]
MPALPTLAALVTVVFWASAFVGIRAAGEDLSPGALALGRLLVGTALLGLFVLARREALPSRRDLPLIAFAGVLWLGVYNVALNAGEQHVDAGTAAMIVGVGPVLIAVLAGLLLGEGFPRRLLVGCAVAFVGVAVIGVATSTSDALGSTGALLCLLAAATYAVAVVVQKPIAGRVSALQTTFLLCVAGTLFCAPFAPSLVREAGDASTANLLWTVYLGVFPTALGFTTWTYALKRTTAGRLGVTTYLVPPISITLGWLLLEETPPALALAGGALCLAGVAISRYERRLRGSRSATRSRSSAPPTQSDSQRSTASNSVSSAATAFPTKTP